MTLNTSRLNQSPYAPFIDGLRSLAVISVIIYHLHAPWLPGGFVGVDVFFVISGFVISASITYFRGTGFWQFVAYFYARRIRRIFPSLIACLLVTGFVAALFIPESWLSDGNQKTGLYAFFGLSNFFLAVRGRNYFAPTMEFNPFAHTWSLGVEEQFYLIFPLLFFVWLKGTSRKKYSVALFAIGLLLSVIFSAWQSQAQPINAYFLSPGRFWELAAGVLLYQVISFSSRENQALGKSWPSSIIGIIAFTGLLLSFVVSSPNHFPMPGALLAVISTLGVIFSLYKKNSLPWLQSLLGNRSMLFIGKRSYSLYLWHWPTFVLFRWTCGLDAPLSRIFALVITLLLAMLSYALIETPIRQYKAVRMVSHPALIAIGLCIITLAYWSAKGINRSINKISFSQVTANAGLWYSGQSPETPEYPGCYADHQKIVEDGVNVWIIKPSGCLEIKPTNYGVLHVFGDSHALAYLTLYKQFAIKNNLEVNVYFNAGCPFLSFQAERDSCVSDAKVTLQVLHKRVKPRDVIFLASLRLPRFGDQWIYFGSEAHQQLLFSAQAQASRERTIKYAIDTLRGFSEQGVRIIFEAPKPIFQAPAFRCADWFNKNNPICAHGLSMPRELLEKYRAPVLSSFKQVIQAIPSISVWDPFPVLCPGKECTVWRDGHSMFFDGDHLSAYGNMTLLPDFTAYMLPKLEKQPVLAQKRILSS